MCVQSRTHGGIFFDLLVTGDGGEEAIVDLMSEVARAKREGGAKRADIVNSLR